MPKQPQNYIYVEDEGKGVVNVYDDAGSVPERTFRYGTTSERADARTKAEDHAATASKKWGCSWGRNYKDRG